MSVLKTRRRVEAPPERPRAVAPAPLPPLPLGAPARSAAVLADLRAADRMLGMTRPAAPRPIALTDWSKKLAWTLAYADAAVVVCVRDAKAQLGSDRNAVGALFRPLFVELADFAAETDDDRGAMLADVNAERVLLAELAPCTAKAVAL